MVIHFSIGHSSYICYKVKTKNTMGRMTYVKALMCLLFPSAALVARAQHPVAGDLKCKLTGRMLMDGGVYLKNDNLFGNGTEFNDLRLGVKATYQNWSMKWRWGM